MKRMQQLGSLLAAAWLLAVPGSAWAVTWSGGNFNWDEPDTDSFTGTYNNGDDVEFAGAGTGTDIAITAGGVSPGNFALSSGTYRFTGGNINAGSFTISGGTLQYTNSAQLGAGTIYVTNAGTLESVRTTQPTTMNNAIVVSDGITVNLKQNNPNNQNTSAPTVGAISGGTVGTPIDVNLVATVAQQRWRLSPSTFIGDVNIVNARVLLENFATTHFGNLDNTVKITAGGLQATGTVEQDIEVTGAFLGGAFDSGLMIANGIVTQTGSQTEIGGTLRLTNPASTFGTWQLNNSSIEFTYPTIGSGTIRNVGGGSPAIRFKGDITGTAAAGIEQYSSSVLDVDVESANAHITWSGAWGANTSDRPMTKSGLGMLSYTGVGGDLAGSTLGITEGTLRINSTLSNVGNTTVSSGARLGGNGTIALVNAGTTLNFASGSILAPGASAGTLNVTTGTTDINGVFTYELELGNAVNDKLAAATLNFDDLTAGTLVVSSLVDWQTFLWDYSTNIPIFTFTSSQSGFDANDWTIVNGGGMKVEGGYLFLQGNTVFLTGVSNVPEPSTMLLLACGGWLLLRTRRGRGMRE